MFLARSFFYHFRLSFTHLEEEGRLTCKLQAKYTLDKHRQKRENYNAKTLGEGMDDSRWRL